MKVLLIVTVLSSFKLLVKDLPTNKYYTCLA